MAGQKGFTLIEVLIAIVVFGFSLMAIVPLLVTASGVTSQQSIKAEALMFAARQLDELKVLDKEELDNYIVAGGGNVYTSTSYLDSSIVKDKPNFYTLTWQIQRRNLGLNVDYYQLVSTISYTYKGKTYTRTLSTFWGY